MAVDDEQDGPVRCTLPGASRRDGGMIGCQATRRRIGNGQALSTQATDKGSLTVLTNPTQPKADLNFSRSGTRREIGPRSPRLRAGTEAASTEMSGLLRFPIAAVEC